jgi:hypothetical protein
MMMLNQVDISERAYGSPWSLILTVGHAPRMGQNRVLRGAFEVKRDEVTGE